MELRQITLEEINKLNKNTLMEALGIECVALGLDFLKVKMPVDHRTKQPMGILHGGASAALIETIGSMGSFLLIDTEKQIPVGLEVNANHLGSVSNGNVIATGKIIHAGRKTHLWQVDIHEEISEKLICTGRLTVMILDKR